ncbi:MAG: hypothetical protein ACHQQQ_15200, partial [Bacteroidota bacterium]
MKYPIILITALASLFNIAMAGKPVVITLPASNITDNSATLNGKVDDNGSNTLYHFFWGLNTNYGHSTPEYEIPAG